MIFIAQVAADEPEMSTGVERGWCLLKRVPVLGGWHGVLLSTETVEVHLSAIWRIKLRFVMHAGQLSIIHA